MKKLLFVLLFSTQLFAFTLSDIYLEPNGRFSYVKSSFFASTGSTPLLFSGSFGLTAGYWLHEDYFLGLSTEYSVLNQYSDIDPLAGNNRGTRWNVITPTLGWRVFNKIVLKVDFEFLGSYNLANPLPGDQYVSYTNPFGIKLTLSIPVVYRVSLGLLFEYVTFSKIENSLMGATSLGTRFVLWQYGIAIGYTIF
jgi:hypothetical protein